MAKSTIRFATFPRTIPPQDFLEDVVLLFKKYEATISTVSLEKGLTSDEVLAVMANDFASLGFLVETSKAKADKIERPVFFGENGSPTLNYQIDA